MNAPAKHSRRRNQSSRPCCIRLLLERLEERICPTTYNYPIIAQTGQDGISAIREFPSINDLGEVAFIGALAAGGEAVFAGAGASLPTNLSGPGSADITYGVSAQINKYGQVLATESEFNPNFDSLKLWNANSSPVTVQSLAGSGVAGTSIFTNATLANDANPATGDGIAFGAITSPGTPATLQMPNPPLGFGTLLSGYTGAGDGLQPMMADNNEVVFQDGNGPSFPIVLNEGPGINFTIASSGDFSALGAAPGISPDGQVIAFYGNLTTGGAAALNSAQPTFTALAAGPGIFASVQTATRRVIIRVAGTGGNAQGLPGVGAFDANNRVAVNSIQNIAVGNSFTVAFMGQSPGPIISDGIYVNLVNVFGIPSNPTGFRPNINTVVAQVGDSLSGVPGTIQALNIDDSINSTGQVAFWVNTGGGVDAVAVADPIPVLAVSYLNQGNSLWASSPYAGGGTNPDTGNEYTIGNNGCALTSLAMALNYAGSPSISYIGQSGFTPASLNLLLEADGGYAGHSINWSTDTDIAAAAGGVSNLVFNYVPPTSPGALTDPQTLTDLLETTHQPVIVGVHVGPNGPNHFVLVTGMVGDQFTINDPGYSDSAHQTLDAYDDEFQIRGYISDPTDISDLSLVAVSASPGVDLLATDPSQRQTGTDPGTGATSGGIPQSVMFSDALEDGVGSSSASETASFVSIFQPQAGTYSLSAGGGTAEPYTIYASPIATDGTLLSPTTFSGTVTPGSVATFSLTYNPQPPPSPPVVTTNPASQVVGAGNSVSFVAAATGHPSPSVQWQVSTDGGNTFTNLAGATSATLTLTATAAQNYSEYRAVFTNPSGSATTSAATLTVTTKPSGLIVSATTGVFPQFNLVNPGLVGQVSPDYFGAQILTLSTGNVVVTDPSGTGAVYLFNGQTGALIVRALTGTGDDPTATALTNGNFVVLSPGWNDNEGAANWASGTTGISGTISAVNSLVGIRVGGSSYISVTALANGAYVVADPTWHDNVGMVAWGNGTTGTTGTVSAANSLVGGTEGDTVGAGSTGSNGVTALPNGGYVVASPAWNGQEGAVTWASATGIVGTISPANSLVGSSSGDSVGDTGVTVLTNGNYVVGDPSWKGGTTQDLGAATWGNGATGVAGPITAGNSLVGSPGNDSVGYSVIALTNGNYVVASPGWMVDEGAVTWGDGTTGVSGTISAANSLVGASRGDQVGGQRGAGVTALANGDYVVSSPSWNGKIGAVTWGNGATGITGAVSTSNSLVGSKAASYNYAGDQVGFGGVTALTNGNYVVSSPYWNGGAGAATWVNGTIAVTGAVSATNSLIGTIPQDHVGGHGVDQFGDQGGDIFALTNGNYVVCSPAWGYGAGAATWGNGSTGTDGTVSEANSLVGSSPQDQVGNGGATALANGDYVVLSPSWTGGGAATWGDGTMGTSGAVSGANSLTNFPSLSIANGSFLVAALPNGDYFVVNAPGQIVTGGLDLPEATWVDGASGMTLDGQQTPDSQNSLIGGGGGVGIQPIQSGASFVFTVAGDDSVKVACTDPNLLTYGFGQGQTITVTPDFITRALDSGTNVTLQADDDLTISSPITEMPGGTAGSLTLEAGRSILLNASINTAGGNLSLIANDTQADGVVDSQRGPGNAAVTMASGVTLNTGSGALLVDLKNSTDKTNNASGAVTLLGVDAGAAVLSSASTLGVTISGTTPGNGVAAGTYTQTNVTGPINLNGASLQITQNAATPAGSPFTIVQTTGGVSGTFQGLSEGATVAAANGTKFTISYQAALGKDVTLTEIGTPLSISPTSLPAPEVGVAYSQTITASGGTAPYTFRVASGMLPAWLKLSSSGVLSGTPTAGGTATFTITAADSSTGTGPYTTAQSYTLTVNTSPYEVSAIPGAGVWRHSSSGWAQLTQTNAAQVGVDSHGDVVAELPGFGVWRFEDATGWLQLTPTNASSVGIAGGGSVVAELPGAGVWRFEDAGGWARLTTTNASGVGIDDRDDVVAELPGFGVWRFEDAGGWAQLTAADASQVSIAGAGIVAVEIQGAGVWRFEDATGWAQLTTTNASGVGIDDRGDVAVELPGFGVWRFEDAMGGCNLPRPTPRRSRWTPPATWRPRYRAPASGSSRMV